MNYRIASSARASGALFVVLFAALPYAGAAQLAGAAGIGASVPAQIGPFVIEGGATANRIGSSVSPRTTLDVASSLSLLLRNGGIWLGASSFSAREIDSLPVRPLLSAGAWNQFRSVTVSFGAQSHVARLGGRPPAGSNGPHSTDSASTNTQTSVDSGAPSRLASWSDLEGGVSWISGRFRFAAVVGARPAFAGNTASVWGRVLAETQLTSRLALSAGVGMQPAQLAIGVPSSQFATIGLNIATWRRGQATVRPAVAAPSFTVSKIDASRYQIEYHLAGAHRVEVSGDFNNWTPVGLREVSAGQWRCAVSVMPGTYHMNVRVDGGPWNAPPGTVEVADDFNGTVGIVVVR